MRPRQIAVAKDPCLFSLGKYLGTQAWWPSGRTLASDCIIIVCICMLCSTSSCSSLAQRSETVAIESVVTGPAVAGATRVESLPRIKELEWIPASSSLKTMMRETVPLDPAAIVVSDSSFRKLLMGETRRGVPSSVRHRGAVMAGALSDSATLGVFAKLRTGAKEVKSNLFVVIRDAAVLPDGDVEGRDAYVAAVELSGLVDWAADLPRLARLTGVTIRPSEPRSRGCRPLFSNAQKDLRPHTLASAEDEMAGLSRETVLNLEAAPGPPNASGFRPTLWLFASPQLQVEPNEFECHAPVGWDHSAGLPPPRGYSLVANKVLSERIPGNAQMLSEQDFMKALTTGRPRPAYSLQAAAVTRIATVANADEAIGVSAQYRVGNQFSGNFFVVARDPQLVSEGRVQASEYYLAAVELSGNATWVGTAPEILLRGMPVPDIPLFGGLCDAVSLPDAIPRCDRLPCGPLPVAMEGSPLLLGGASTSPEGYQPPFGPTIIPLDGQQPLFGSDRWPESSRVTLRVPTLDRGRIDFAAIACTMFPPPPPRLPPFRVDIKFVPEECNGIDDNNNGEIDEGACANRDASCICQPTTCAQQSMTSGQTHDGCGQLLTCGPPL